MLLFCRFHSIGILLCLLHTSRSFVLLTANIDDVKKLASKFVSESMAEKIAEFIAKATEHIITNVSDEVMIDQVSEENNKYNIARERKEAASQKVNNDVSIASYENVPRETNVKHDANYENTERIKAASNYKYLDNYRQENNFKYMNDNPEKVRFVTKRQRDEIQPNYIKANRDNGVKVVQSQFENVMEPAGQYYAMESNGKMNSKYVQSNLKTKSKENRELSYPNKVISTIGYAEDIRIEELKATKKLKSKINHSRTHKVNIKKHLELYEKDAHRNRTDGGTLRAVKELTTKRIRNEFDQYDNMNYPKPDFVATSGPVALPKIPNHKWIETDNEEVTKKFWF